MNAQNQTNLNAGFFQMVDETRNVNLRIQLIGQRLICFSMPSLRLILHAFHRPLTPEIFMVDNTPWKTRWTRRPEICDHICWRQQQLLHDLRVWLVHLRNFLGQMDDWSILALGIFHAVTQLVGKLLQTKRATSRDTDVEDEVETIWGKVGMRKFRILGRGQDWGLGVQPGGNREDGLVYDRYLEGMYVDLLDDWGCIF